MATLETIRTKAGVLITIVIGIALVSFIINADTLTMAMNMFSSKNDVGVIASERIPIDKFSQKVEYYTQMYQIGSNQEALSDEQQAEMSNQAWNYFLRENVMFPQFRQIGLGVSEEELTDNLTGDDPAENVRQLFTNPNTGQFDRDQLKSVLLQLDENPRLKAYWLSIEQSTYENQFIRKYMTLVSQSNFVSSVEANFAAACGAENVNFDYVMKDFASIPDTAVKVTNSDLQSYFKQHKNEYKHERGRDIKYVVFPITPSAADYETATQTITEIKKELETIRQEDLASYVRQNSDEPFDDLYKERKELTSVVDSFAFSNPIGSVSEFYQVGSTYYVSRIADRKLLPDSIKAEHILLNEMTYMKADSIIALLNAGANFAEMSEKFSSDRTANANGGKLDWFSFNQMVRPFSDSCFYGKKGSFMKVITQFGLHIVRVTDSKNDVLKAQIATVAVKTNAGRDTENAIFARAKEIESQSNGSAEAFKRVVQEAALQLVSSDNLPLSAKVLNTIDGASIKGTTNITRWAYEAEEGDVSSVETVDGGNAYIIACLDKIKNEGFSDFEEIKDQLQVKVLRLKKAQKLVKEFQDVKSKGGLLADMATSLNLKVNHINSGSNFNTNYIPTMNGFEQGLLGAAVGLKEGIIGGPISGENGVYLVQTTSRQPNGTTPESEKMRLERAKAASAYEFYEVLMKKANLVDNRGKFY